MPTMSLYCYLIPIIGALTFIILNSPLLNDIFISWIPNEDYRNFTKSLVLLAVLYIFCIFFGI